VPAFSVGLRLEMSEYDFSPLSRGQEVLVASKDSILHEWVEAELCEEILKRHEIDTEVFVEQYAGSVFDYFMGVVSGYVTLGECPVIGDLIDYLKDKELRADELFVPCTHFKRSVINATYRLGINNPEIFAAISYLFDRNFAGVLKLYTDTIYQKEQEAINAGKAKEYFLSNMSHEIRTPLNAILGFVALLKDEAINPRHQNYLDIIANSGENLLHIINDILDFSKLRSGEFTIDPQPFNIHDEISHTMELFVPSANSKSITLTSFIDPSIPYEIVTDALRIKQIVGNFLSNAIKFSHPDGAIHVEARWVEGVLIISVCDSGIGIAEADLERIFDAFSQAHEGNHKINEGSGLGLSICKQLAEHMNGSIELSSTMGGGSTFTLKVPVEANEECAFSKFDTSVFQNIAFGLLAYDEKESYKLESLHRYWDYFDLHVRQIAKVEEDCDLIIFFESSIDDTSREMIIRQKIPAVAIMDFLDDRYDTTPNIISLTFPIYCTKLQRALSDVLGMREEAVSSIEPSYNKQRGFEGAILVAEDNPANQELIKMILERYGLSCTIANDGLEALAYYKSVPFDLVFMDEQMPRLNGNGATAAIRSYEQEHGIFTPIIALTANVIKGSRERAIQNGYDAFLGKPIILKELEQLFERYLESTVILRPQVHTYSFPYSNIDMEHLKAALMLETAQVEKLLEMYKSKMEHSLDELKSAVEQNDYEVIQRIAHSIKGSSANFRFEELFRLASLIEESATQRDTEFDFEDAFSVMRSEFLQKFA
jgi:signal transduction histidine kinase/CheY-like chemotaxis protein/HPt (histidine-containing phosphotransfer) domain-containing protein